jgi:hypothetical protein
MGNDAQIDQLAAINAQLNQIEFGDNPVIDMTQEVITPAVVVTMPNKLIPRRHSFELGQELFYYRYVEPSLNVYITGAMSGYQAKYAYRPLEADPLNNSFVNVYGFEAQYASGSLDYKGSGKISGESNKTFDLRGILGKDFIYEDSMRITPYVGIAYRYLMDHANGRLSSDNHIGYDRESNYYYVPIGFNVYIPNTKSLDVSFNFEYDYFLQGAQKSHLGNADQFISPNQYSDIRNHQSKGYGIRTSVKLLKHFSSIDLYVEPFIRVWNIKDSKVQTVPALGSTLTGIEPKNTTTEIGSKVGVQF